MSEPFDAAYLDEKINQAERTWEGVDTQAFLDEVRGRENDESELPEGWAQATFGEINQFDGETVDPAESPEETLELYSVPVFPSNRPEIISGGEIGSTKQAVEPQDVLVCKINPRINRVWVVGTKANHRQIASSEWIGFRPNGLDSRYFQWLFRSPDFRDLICTDLTGVGGSLTRAQPKRVAGFPLPIPPLPEQKRIVAKLDTLLSRLGECQVRLERVPALLKRFRQSVLAAATSGRLTEDWRAKRPGFGDSAEKLFQRIQKEKRDWLQNNPSHNESSRVRHRLEQAESRAIEHNSDLPNTWRLCRLEDVLLLVVDCHNKTAPSVKDGIPLIRTPNIRNMRLETEDMKYVDEETFRIWSRRCIPEPGDLVFTREAPMGEAMIIPPGYQICLGQRTMLFRPIPSLVSPKFILYSIYDEGFQQRARDGSVGTGVKHLRVGDVGELAIAVPSTEEQLEIVCRLESLLALADRIEARYQAAKAKVYRLQPALLAKAFRGDLVAQDPNDEPASVLLERVKAQSGTERPPSRRGRQRK